MQISAELSSRFISGWTRMPAVVSRDMKNRHVIYVNRPAGETYIVKRGYVRLVYVQPDGGQLTRMLLGKGAMFGDLPFQPAFFTPNEQAITSGQTCVLKAGRLELENHAIATPDFQLLMLQIMLTQFQALDRRIQWQFVSPLRARIAAALSDLICFSGGRCGHGHLIDVRLTHEEFAELIIAARPVVSKVLGELKAEGIIEYTRSHVCILSLDRLQSIAGIAQ